VQGYADILLFPANVYSLENMPPFQILPDNSCCVPVLFDVRTAVVGNALDIQAECGFGRYFK
jgi:hypothetical protein